MKSANKISTLRPFAFALMLISIELFMLFSCQKDESINNDDVEEILDAPDEKNDLVAFLDPLAGILWADPEHIETVLSMLDATPMSGNLYVKQGITPSGRPVQIQFTVQPVNTTEIYLQATAADADTDPDLIKEFEEKGTKYRVYKNAECGKTKPGFTGPCENLSDGISRHRVWNAYPKCKRGNGFCTEVLAVGGVEVTYHNQNCQGLIKSKKEIFLYQCQ